MAAATKKTAANKKPANTKVATSRGRAAVTRALKSANKGGESTVKGSKDGEDNSVIQTAKMLAKKHEERQAKLAVQKKKEEDQALQQKRFELENKQSGATLLLTSPPKAQQGPPPETHAAKKQKVAEAGHSKAIKPSGTPPVAKIQIPRPVVTPDPDHEALADDVTHVSSSVKNTSDDDNSTLTEDSFDDSFGAQLDNEMSSKYDDMPLGEAIAKGLAIDMESHDNISKQGDVRAEELMKKKESVIKDLEYKITTIISQLEEAQKGNTTDPNPVLMHRLQDLEKQMYLGLKKAQEVEATNSALQKSKKKVSEKLAEERKKNNQLKKELDKAKKASGSPNDSETTKKLKEQLKEARSELLEVKRDYKNLHDDFKLAETTAKKAEAESKSLKTQLTTTKNKLTAANKDLNNLKSSQRVTRRGSVGSVGTATTSSTGATKTTKALKDEIKVLKREKKELEDKYRDSLTKLKEYHNILKKVGKAADWEVKPAIKAAAREYLKDVVFRTTKFITSKPVTSTDKNGKKVIVDEVAKLTEKVYYGIKDQFDLDKVSSNDYIPKDEFHRIYQQSLMKYHSTLRSNTQTACLNALVLWYTEHDWMPKIDDLKTVYDVLSLEEPPERQDGEDPAVTDARDAYVRKKDLLLWYLDKYLPAACGEASMAKTSRYYKKIVDLISLRGKGRVMVESASEAYGWLLLDNCYEKWKLIAPKKAKDDKWKTPKYDASKPTTHPYHVTKYSDPRGGQGAGWNSTARKAMTGYQKIIKDLREEDQKNGWAIFGKALEWLRVDKEVTDWDPFPKKTRKRKRKTKATVEEDDFVEMDDESDGAYSVHSEAEADAGDGE